MEESLNQLFGRPWRYSEQACADFAAGRNYTEVVTLVCHRNVNSCR